MNLRLREVRIMRGLSQSELAEMIHVSREAYTLYELGKRHPSMETLVALSEALNISTDYLLGRTDRPFPGYEMTFEEQNLVERYRELDSRGRNTVLRLMLCEQLSYEGVPIPLPASGREPSTSDTH